MQLPIQLALHLVVHLAVQLALLALQPTSSSATSASSSGIRAILARWSAVKADAPGLALQIWSKSNSQFRESQFPIPVSNSQFPYAKFPNSNIRQIWGDSGLRICLKRVI